MHLTIPRGYKNILGSVENTEKAIKNVKDMFQDNLSAQLTLLRVTAPMTVPSGSVVTYTVALRHSKSDKFICFALGF